MLENNALEPFELETIEYFSNALQTNKPETDEDLRVIHSAAKMFDAELKKNKAKALEQEEDSAEERAALSRLEDIKAEEEKLMKLPEWKRPVDIRQRLLKLKEEGRDIRLGIVNSNNERKVVGIQEQLRRLEEEKESLSQNWNGRPQLSATRDRLIEISNERKKLEQAALGRRTW